jgi:pimeloyl-ACP methyl ester carboxylesterase/DNA-binding CsgD family transcriptional regulator
LISPLASSTIVWRPIPQVKHAGYPYVQLRNEQIGGFAHEQPAASASDTAPHHARAGARCAVATKPLDVLLVPDGFLPAVSMRSYPPYARYLAELQRIGRLILFDRRGLGPQPPASRTIALGDWVEDAEAALEAARASATIVIGAAEGAITAIALAATRPEKVAGLVLINPTPGPSLTQLARCGLGPRYIELLRWRPEAWAQQPWGLQVVAPSLGRDQAFTAWLRDAFLQIGWPQRMQPAFDVLARTDVRPLLARVQTPTLVVHRRDDAWFSPDHGQLIARGITGARYLELPGADHAPYIGDTDAIIDAIRWFANALPMPGPEQQNTECSPRSLTSRQTHVLELVAAGLTDKQIAARLGLSTRTVQKHLERAYRRLGVQSRTAATRRLSPS